MSRPFRVLCAVAIAVPSAQQPSLDDFFRTISDGWVRLNPDLAVTTRYFSGEEQDRLEQQISSYSDAAERQRLEYIQRGHQQLGRFDRSRMTDAQRLSADVLRYHLQSYLDWAKYDDHVFPLDQFNGGRTCRTTSRVSARSGRAWPRLSSSRASAPPGI